MPTFLGTTEFLQPNSVGEAGILHERSSRRHAERGRARPPAQRSAEPGAARHEHQKRTNNVLRAGSRHWHAQTSLGSPTGVASRGRAGCACLRAGLGLRHNQRQMGSLAWEGVQQLPPAGAGRRVGCRPGRGGEQPVVPGEDSGARPVPAPGPRSAPRRGVAAAPEEEDDLFLYLKQVMFMQRHLNDSRSEGQI